MVSNLGLNRVKSAFTQFKNKEWTSDSVEREWTSGNSEVDEFIRSTQSSEFRIQQLEWIPYKELRKIKEIGEGGSSKVFVAQWNRLSEKCSRFVVSGSAEERRLDGVDKRVVLKQLKNSANITLDFLEELKTYYAHYSRDYGFFLLLRYYGISKNPITNEYIIVMEYCEHGSLNSRLAEISEHFEVKLYVLVNIARKIKAIHSFGVVHRNLHLGNILLGYDMIPHLSDMGLSGPISAEDSNRTNGYYGIMPYVAPEVLQGKPYTKAADIYSFGVIMWEFLTGKKAFSNKAHDGRLQRAIIDGLRPLIIGGAPECYVNLMKRCWDNNPENRPNANELCEILSEWNKMEPGGRTQQFADFDENIRSTFLDLVEISFANTHPEATYVSRFSPYISRQENGDINERFTRDGDVEGTPFENSSNSSIHSTVIDNNKQIFQTSVL